MESSKQERSMKAVGLYRYLPIQDPESLLYIFCLNNTDHYFPAFDGALQTVTQGTRSGCTLAGWALRLPARLRAYVMPRS